MTLIPGCESFCEDCRSRTDESDYDGADGTRSMTHGCGMYGDCDDMREAAVVNLDDIIKGAEGLAYVVAYVDDCDACSRVFSEEACDACHDEQIRVFTFRRTFDPTTVALMWAVCKAARFGITTHETDALDAHLKEGNR